MPPSVRPALRLTAAFAAVAAILPAAAGAAAAPAVSGQLLVGFDTGVPASRQAEILADAGGTVRRRIPRVRGGRLAVAAPKPGGSTDTLRRRLAAADGVAYAEPDYELQATGTPDDTLFAQQWGLSEPNGHDIDAPDTWSTRTSCSSVAALDSGADTDHPDLKANLSYNSKEIRSNGKDDDRNGYVDDYYGINLVKGYGDGEDDNGHGTHVAGIIAAKGNNDAGVAGLCWKGYVLPVKFMNSRGTGATSDAIEGIDYAVSRGVKIINCSFGSSSASEGLHDAIDYAQSKGVLLVVAAGNDGEDIDSHPTYPASYTDSNILTVAATTTADALASFSNYGDTGVDVAAPGDEIVSTYLGGGYKALSGTSMAAPMVAGTAALLRKTYGDASYSDLRTTLRKYGIDKPSALKDEVVYDGRLDAKKAIDFIVDLKADRGD